MFQERWFQEESTEETYKKIENYILGKESPKLHPTIVAPTGCGKTVIICKLIDRILSENPLKNILVLCDDKKILLQDHKTIEDYFEIEAGLCNAELQSYEIRKITVGGIQTIYRKWKDFVDFDVVIIDEAHTINTKEVGMYRNFLKKIGDVYIGLTATNFRTGHGYIHEGKDSLFNCISYDMSSPEIFNRIIKEGFLKPLFSYPTALKLSGEGCRTTAGDWNEKDLAEKNDREEITRAAVLESIYYGKKYKHWLFFAINIEHCENIKKMLIENGIDAVAIHSKNENKNEDIESFKNGKVRAAVNVNMLVKGFDFPAIDLICDMRPTKSPIIHVQGKGRGTRPVYAKGEYDLNTIDGRLQAIQDSGITHCLVLDFAGNTERLGPINHVQIKTKTDKKTKSGPVTKNCPECKFINWGGAKFCENCNFEFEFKEKLKIQASQAELIKDLNSSQFEIKKNIKEWVNVDNVDYNRHTGRNGKPDTFRVNYKCGLRRFSEFICIEHHGYPKHTANNWISFRWMSSEKKPNSISMLLENSSYLKRPKQIFVDDTGKFPQILDCRF